MFISSDSVSWIWYKKGMFTIILNIYHTAHRAYYTNFLNYFNISVSRTPSFLYSYHGRYMCDLIIFSIWIHYFKLFWLRDKSIWWHCWSTVKYKFYTECMGKTVPLTIFSPLERHVLICPVLTKSVLSFLW